MNLADRIQELRKKNGFSQEEFASVLGVSRQAVSKWESGQSNPDLDKIVSISELFNVSTDYLLKGMENDESNNTKVITDLYYGCFIVFALLAIIIAFFANRFRYDEILFIGLFSGVIGLGVAMIIKSILKLIMNRHSKTTE